MNSKKYVLFGAGNYGLLILNWLSVENVAFFVDNSTAKQGTMIDGIRVYSLEEKKRELSDYIVVLSANVGTDSSMADDLRRVGIDDFLTYKDIERELITERIKSSNDNIQIYNKAIDWVKRYTVEDSGIINNTGQPEPYPEVTGYFIPTLLRWGYRDLAVSYADWLCSIQKEDGSWWGTYDDAPYIFDTAQIIKGLLAVRHILPDVDDNIIKGCNWLLSQIEENGRLPACDERVWGDGKTLSELIHLYCLSPLKEAGILYDKPEYSQSAFASMKYYLSNYRDIILDFHLLSHFYAYIVEGLLDMGEISLAKEAMRKIASIQKDSGAVPAYKDVDWVCSTGLFQFAVIWYRLDDIEHAEKAFKYACSLQNESGGWFGSYISEDNIEEYNTYLPLFEISWAVKYFLDALYYRSKAVFNHRKELYIDRVDRLSTVYQVVIDAVDDMKKNNSGKTLKIADVGCGRGSYLKNLVEDFSNEKYYGIDISAAVLDTIEIPNITKCQGSLTNIPYDDEFFDMTYACESLEHVVDYRSAIKEMTRVTKPGGIILIIDKELKAMGTYVIEKWEQFYDEEELRDIISIYCSDVKVVNNIGHKNNPAVMSAWIGRVKK